MLIPDPGCDMFPRIKMETNRYLLRVTCGCLSVGTLPLSPPKHLHIQTYFNIIRSQRDESVILAPLSAEASPSFTLDITSRKRKHAPG